MEPFSIDVRAYSGRILAAVFFLLSAVVRSVWLRARAGKEERERRNARETLPAPTARRGRAAGEQGHKRSYWIAVWRLSLLLPLLRCCFSWCWRSGSPCSCCSRCSCFSCRACNSRFERASRSTIARFPLGAQVATRAPQEAPRRPQERQETPRQRREAPSKRQEVAKTRARAISERFWLDFGPPSKTIEKARFF